MTAAASDAPGLAALLLSPPALAVLGLCIGSFLNVVILRLPVMMRREWWSDIAAELGDAAAYRAAFDTRRRPPASLSEAAGDIARALKRVRPLSYVEPARSACPRCGHRLAWHENLPLVGWLRLRGRCSSCGSPISLRYPVVEGLTGALFLLLGLRYGPTVTALVWCAAAALLVAMTMIDIDTQYLPDDLTIPLVGLGIAAAGAGLLPVTLEDSAWGAFWGFVALWGVNALWKVVRGVDGIGGGDFKLLAGLGAMLGWKLLPAVVLLAAVVGAAVGLALIFARRHGWAKPIPFGPYLVGGGLAAAFYGLPLTCLYFRGIVPECSP